MAKTDPIADYLTRIRNAIMARHESVEIPASKMTKRLTEILHREGYIRHYYLLDDGRQGTIHIDLLWNGRNPAIRELKRKSKPGRRVYVGADALPRVRNGHGVAIISTSRGVMSDREARKQHVGGEWICSVW